MDIQQAVKAWEALLKKQDDLREALRQNGGDILEFERSWRRKHPLSDEQKKFLATLLKGGEKLCCHSGLELLKQHFDPLWSQFLNHWAHEALGCSDYWDTPEARIDAVKKLDDLESYWREEDKWIDRRQQH